MLAAGLAPRVARGAKVSDARAAGKPADYRETPREGGTLLPMPDDTICAMCHALVTPGAAYVVRIEVFAEPTVEIDRREASPEDLRAEIEAIIVQLAGRSAAEAQDEVHRRLAFTICPACQRRYLENPLPPP